MDEDTSSSNAATSSTTAQRPITKLAEASKAQLLTLLTKQTQKLKAAELQVTALKSTNEKLQNEIAASAIGQLTQSNNEKSLEEALQSERQVTADLKLRIDAISQQLSADQKVLAKKDEELFQVRQHAASQAEVLERLEGAYNEKESESVALQKEFNKSKKLQQTKYEEIVQNSQKIQEEFTQARKEWESQNAVMQQEISDLQNRVTSLLKENEILTKEKHESENANHNQQPINLEAMETSYKQQLVSLQNQFVDCKVENDTLNGELSIMKDKHMKEELEWKKNSDDKEKLMEIAMQAIRDEVTRISVEYEQLKEKQRAGDDRFSKRWEAVQNERNEWQEKLTALKSEKDASERELAVITMKLQHEHDEFKELLARKDKELDEQAKKLEDELLQQCQKLEMKAKTRLDEKEIHWTSLLEQKVQEVDALAKNLVEVQKVCSEFEKQQQELERRYKVNMDELNHRTHENIESDKSSSFQLIESRIVPLVMSIKSDRQDIENQLKQLQTEWEAATQKFSHEVVKRQLLYSQRLAIVDDLNETVAQKTEEVSRLHNEIDRLSVSLRELQEFADNKKKEDSEILATRKDFQKESERTVKALNEKINEITMEKQTFEHHLNDLQLRLDSKQAELENLQRTSATIQDELSGAHQAKIEMISQLQHDLHHLQLVIAEKDARIDMLNQQSASVETKLQNVELENQHNESNLKSQLDQITETLTMKQQECTQLFAEIEQCRASLAQAESKIDEQAKVYDAFQQSLESQQSQSISVQDHEQKLEELKIDWKSKESAYENTINKLKAIVTKLKEKAIMQKEEIQTLKATVETSTSKSTEIEILLGLQYQVNEWLDKLSDQLIDHLPSKDTSSPSAEADSVSTSDRDGDSQLKRFADIATAIINLFAEVQRLKEDSMKSVLRVEELETVANNTQSLQTQIESLNSELASVKEESSSKHAELTTAEAKITGLEDKIAKMKTLLLRANKHIEECKKQLASQNSDNTRISTKIDHYHELMKEGWLPNYLIHPVKLPNRISQRSSVSDGSSDGVPILAEFDAVSSDIDDEPVSVDLCNICARVEVDGTFWVLLSIDPAKAPEQAENSDSSLSSTAKPYFWVRQSTYLKHKLSNTNASEFEGLATSLDVHQEASLPDGSRLPPTIEYTLKQTIIEEQDLKHASSANELQQVIVELNNKLDLSSNILNKSRDDSSRYRIRAQAMLQQLKEENERLSDRVEKLSSIETEVQKFRSMETVWTERANADYDTDQLVRQLRAELDARETEIRQLILTSDRQKQANLERIANVEHEMQSLRQQHAKEVHQLSHMKDKDSLTLSQQLENLRTEMQQSLADRENIINGLREELKKRSVHSVHQHESEEEKRNKGNRIDSSTALVKAKPAPLTIDVPASPAAFTAAESNAKTEADETNDDEIMTDSMFIAMDHHMREDELTKLRAHIRQLQELLRSYQLSEAARLSTQQTERAQVEEDTRRNVRANELQNSENIEYLKNVLVRYMESEDASLLPVLTTMLHLSPDEVEKLKKKKTTSYIRPSLFGFFQ